MSTTVFRKTGALVLVAGIGVHGLGWAAVIVVPHGRGLERGHGPVATQSQAKRLIA
jgi:hypothetical protein